MHSLILMVLYHYFSPLSDAFGISLSNKWFESLLMRKMSRQKKKRKKKVFPFVNPKALRQIGDHFMRTYSGTFKKRLHMKTI